MQSSATHSESSSSKARANQDSSRQALPVKDNKPEAAQLKEMKEMTQTSPRMTVQRQQFASALGGATGETSPNETGMPDQLKSGLENMSGMDLSDVKVHYNSSKPAQLQALAYAQGNEIHLGPGQEKHLPHEGWHVVQQKQGRVKATMQMKGIAVNDDQGLEKEADVMGEKALEERISQNITEAGSPVQKQANVDSKNNPRQKTITVIQRKIGIEFETRNKLWQSEKDDDISGLDGLFDMQDAVPPLANGALNWNEPLKISNETDVEKNKRIADERTSLTTLNNPTYDNSVEDGKVFKEIKGADMFDNRWYVESDSGWAEFITKPLLPGDVITCLEKIKDYLEWVKSVNKQVPFHDKVGQETVYGINPQGNLTTYGRPQITINGKYDLLNKFITSAIKKFPEHAGNAANTTYREYKKGDDLQTNLDQKNEVAPATMKAELEKLYKIFSDVESEILSLSINPKILNLFRHMYWMIYAAHTAKGGEDYMKSKFLFLTRLNPIEIVKELLPLELKELTTNKKKFTDLIEKNILKGGSLLNDHYAKTLTGDTTTKIQQLTADSYFDDLILNKNDSIISLLKQHLKEGATDRAIGAFDRDPVLAPDGTNTVEIRGILPRGNIIMDINGFIDLLKKMK